MKKLISVILVIVLTLSLATVAFAAPDVSPNQFPTSPKTSTGTATSKLTYEERLAALKTNYGVTNFSKYTYPETVSTQTTLNLLGSAEGHLAKIGPTAMKIITSSWVKSVGHFSIRFGSKQMWGIYVGEFGSGTMSSVISEGDTLSERTFFHEIGHAWDLGALGYEGSAAMLNLNGPYVKNSGTESTTDHGRLNAAEDFAATFEELMSGGTCRWDTSHIVYKKLTAVYNLMLRDFGAESATVKQAARYLGIEPPVVTE